MDPYIGLLYSPDNWVVFHPLYQTTHQGFEYCSPEILGETTPGFSLPPRYFLCFRWLARDLQVDIST